MKINKSKKIQTNFNSDLAGISEEEVDAQTKFLATEASGMIQLIKERKMIQ